MRKLTTLIYVCGCALTFSAQAQNQDEATFLVKEKSAEKVGDKLAITMHIDVSGMDIPKSRSVVCTPIIESGDSLRALPQIILNGKTRHILYERMERQVQNPPMEFEYRRHNGEQQTLDYEVYTPYADWMERSQVSLIMDDCGCGWEALSSNKSPLFALNFAQPIVLQPQVVYVTPQAEEVKARKLEGSAYLDFPVNQTTIQPEYRNNPAELAKIKKSIEAVRNNKFATISGLTIKGYASPEGSYKSNAYLAEHRAKSLLNYVENLYDFGNAKMQVDYEPEDWDGLEKAIEEGNLPDKEELLAIIRADEPTDWDAREWKLKTLNGGSSYKILLRDVYPALRHSDYTVNYTIRNFTVDEAKELVFSNPSQLSLNEMFQVAQTYEPGTAEFNEVFEVAVRMYPDDPVSNLNAAISAIQAKQFDKARRYLTKAQDCPEKQLAEAALLMHEGKLDEAEGILEAIKNISNVSEKVNDNLTQIQAKKKELINNK